MRNNYTVDNHACEINELKKMSGKTLGFRKNNKRYVIVSLV